MNREDFLPVLATVVACSKSPVRRGGISVAEYLMRYRNHTAHTGLLCARYGLWRVEAKKTEAA